MPYYEEENLPSWRTKAGLALSLLFVLLIAAYPLIMLVIWKIGG